MLEKITKKHKKVLQYLNRNSILILNWGNMVNIDFNVPYLAFLITNVWRRIV